MKIDLNIVRHVAMLGRLSLTPKEEKLYVSQLSKILEYVDLLQKVETKKTNPTYHVLSDRNVFREDEPQKISKRADILANAPETEDGAFRVPKFIPSE